MKVIVSLVYLLLLFDLHASELSCSRAGTTVFHVNGFFTSFKDQNLALERLIRVLDTEKKLIDANDEQFSLPINIYSQGGISDKLNFYKLALDSKLANFAFYGLGVAETSANISGIIERAPSVSGIILSKFSTKTVQGTKNFSFAANSSHLKNDLIFVANTTSLTTNIGRSKNLLDAVFSQDGDEGTASGLLKLAPNVGILKADPFSIKNTINFLSLWTLEGNYKLAVNNSRDTTINSELTTRLNIKKIKNEILKKLENYNGEAHKIIISAHKEGNLLVRAALENIFETESERTKKLINDYVAIVATSPTSNPYHGKYFYMLNSRDENFTNHTYRKNYYFLNDFSTFNSSYSSIVSLVGKGYRRDNFLDDYTNGEVLADSYSGYGEKRQNMLQHFAANLHQAGAALESNCINASFKYQQLGLTVDFNATETANPYGDNLTYVWNLGDGNVIQTSEPFLNYRYGTVGTYNVTLNVSDPYGYQSEITKSVVINEGNATFCNAGLLESAMHFKILNNSIPDFDLKHYKYFSPEGVYLSSTCECKVLKIPEGEKFDVSITTTDVSDGQNPLSNRVLPFSGSIGQGFHGFALYTKMVDDELVFYVVDGLGCSDVIYK